jgi:hypothetical protein
MYLYFARTTLEMAVALSYALSWLSFNTCRVFMRVAIEEFEMKLENARCVSTICTGAMIVIFALAAYKVIPADIAGAVILILASIIVIHQLIIKPRRNKRASHAKDGSDLRLAGSNIKHI